MPAWYQHLASLFHDDLRLACTTVFFQVALCMLIIITKFYLLKYFLKKIGVCQNVTMFMWSHYTGALKGQQLGLHSQPLLHYFISCYTHPNQLVHNKHCRSWVHIRANWWVLNSGISLSLWYRWSSCWQTGHHTNGEEATKEDAAFCHGCINWQLYTKETPTRDSWCTW